jgi:hypothetical protein
MDIKKAVDTANHDEQKVKSLTEQADELEYKAKLAAEMKAQRDRIKAARETIKENSEPFIPIPEFLKQGKARYIIGIAVLVIIVIVISAAC